MRFPKARLCCLLSLLYLAVSSAAHAKEKLDFAKDIRPILSNACFQCHGPDAQTREADLRLDLAESAAMVTELDESGQSVLLERVLADDPNLKMPPPESLHPLNDLQKAKLLEWARQGAAYQQHWAFVVPKKQAVPKAAIADWGNNPIDAFAAKAMQARGFQPSHQAASETLLRRLTFDLTGLPPSPELRRGFRDQLSDSGREVAIAWAIESLMSSRSYGEHMALPWLEAARYADTDGYQNDRYRYQHAWRDWVIRAFNDKMPYDQFVREQLAGDMLPEATLWQQVASGFGRNHRINSEDGSIPEEWRVENVVDRVDTFGTVFLGLTLGCARCHDHKYDPISQKEYYQLFAYFNNVAEHGVGPNNGNSPPFVELPPSWPLLAADEDHSIVPDPVKLSAARKGTAGNGLKRPQAGSPKTVMVMHELADPRATYLLRRGRYNQPDTSELLEPQVPAALQLHGSAPADRLELAEWLLEAKNPLTARVAVNRLWQQFFGVGLVPTSDNLGSQGALPTHPELLDWLAAELVRSRWDLQHIQRLIVSSATYQQSSRQTLAAEQADPANRWLARGPRLRLSAFALRDQALALSGLLVQQTGGESVKPYMPEKIWAAFSNNKYKQDKGEKLFRRSLYTYWRRTIPPPTMMNFNAAAREVCSVYTERTNTPLQALTLLNNKTFVEAARALAERSILESSQDIRDQVVYMVELSLGRKAELDEVETLLQAYKEFQLQLRAEPKATEELLSVGESPRDKDLDSERHAALTLVASLVLNLDELLTKE
ncbi:MAG: PSD1 and planctomycete cytochrome C domain-containing protein [Planctomycetota bacterium]|nr:PSD1 and planctomycete cytochrome C domain-containing protein [Planctomycetota bacterium]